MVSSYGRWGMPPTPVGQQLFQPSVAVQWSFGCADSQLPRSSSAHQPSSGASKRLLPARAYRGALAGWPASGQPAIDNGASLARAGRHEPELGRLTGASRRPVAAACARRASCAVWLASAATIQLLQLRAWPPGPGPPSVMRARCWVSGRPGEPKPERGINSNLGPDALVAAVAAGGARASHFCSVRPAPGLADDCGLRRARARAMEARACNGARFFFVVAHSAIGRHNTKQHMAAYEQKPDQNKRERARRRCRHTFQTMNQPTTSTPHAQSAPRLVQYGRAERRRAGPPPDARRSPKHTYTLKPRWSVGLCESS